MDSTGLNEPYFAAENAAAPVFLDHDATDQRANTPRLATIRTLHLINGEHFSGAERVQDLLAMRLPQSGYEVGFACLKPAKFPTARTAQNAQLFTTPMRSKFDLGIVQTLTGIVRQHDYKLIHTHTPRTLMLGVALKMRTGLPLVYHVHSPTSRDSTRPIHNRVNARIESVGMRFADRLITVSDSLAQYVKRGGVSPAKITVVRNGVPKSTVQRSNLRPSGTWTIGSVALFRPRKGIEVLLDAVAILRRGGVNVRIHAVGPFETESYEQLIKQRVRDCGLVDAVHWTGFTSDVQAELEHMDLFALPSLFGEGLPMVVLEAMAAGVPVVSTLVEGVPEAVRDGLDGALAPPNDPAAFARAIQRTMGELDWVELQKNAMERHAACFSDTSMAAGVAAVYRQLLES